MIVYEGFYPNAIPDQEANGILVQQYRIDEGRGYSADHVAADFLTNASGALAESAFVQRLSHDDAFDDRVCMRIMESDGVTADDVRRATRHGVEFWAAVPSAVQDVPAGVERPASLRLWHENTGHGRLERAWQTVTGLGQLVHIEMFVRPDSQRLGLSTAMAYTALGGVSGNRLVVMDVPVGDEVTAAWAERYGLQASPVYQAAQFGYEQLPMRRYAGVVGEVRAAMSAEDAKPWLEGPDVNWFTSADTAVVF